MTNPAGTRGETARVKYLKARGWTYARRITKEGARDKGDVIFGESVPVMIESKETKGFTPAEFLRQMEAQIVHADAEFGFVIVKRRGTTDVGEYYALTNVRRMMWLVEKVWEPPVKPKVKVLRRVR